MQIAYLGKGDFRIKTKQSTVLTGDNFQVNDFVLPGEGEYEIAGVRVQSIDKTVIFIADGISLAYLDKRKKEFTEEELERLEDTDIIFIPVGGGEVFDAKEALKAIKSIEPKIVIPMHYEDISEFSRLEGINPEQLDELKIKGELPEESIRKVVVLNVKTK